MRPWEISRNEAGNFRGNFLGMKLGNFSELISEKSRNEDELRSERGLSIVWSNLGQSVNTTLYNCRVCLPE